MDTFLSMTTQTLSIQFLESTYLLDNSRNIDTIQSRVQFLETVVERLIPIGNLPDYKFYVQVGIDDYKIRYQNRLPTQENISGLIEPSVFNFQNYYIKSLVSGLKRYIEAQFEEIQFLKTSGSKDKRLSKVIREVLKSKNFLEMKFSNTAFYSDGLSEIETIIKKIKAYHETI